MAASVGSVLMCVTLFVPVRGHCGCRSSSLLVVGARPAGRLINEGRIARARARARPLLPQCFALLVSLAHLGLLVLRQGLQQLHLLRAQAFVAQ